MGLRLGTQEAADECLRRQDEDPAFKEKFKGLSITLLFVGTDCPGNEDRQLALDIENGHFNEILVSAKPAPSDLRTAPFDHTKYDFRVQGPQQTLVDMINGKLDILQALDKVKIEGDIGKLMAQFAGFVGFLEVLGTMDLEP